MKADISKIDVYFKGDKITITKQAAKHLKIKQGYKIKDKNERSVIIRVNCNYECAIIQARINNFDLVN